MELTVTSVFEENATAWSGGKYRRALNEGGTSSSKTYSILQLLVVIAKHAKTPLIISVVSESLPHLKRGCIRDFKAIMEAEFDESCWNKTDCIYTFLPSRTILEFFGADEPDKVRGPRRDILFLNEGNNIPWETARGLDIRTERFTFVDWNPVVEFWAHQYWVGQPENVFIHSTYKDALQVLPKEVVQNIESNQNKDFNWWRIYGLGLLGKLENLIWPRFEIVAQLPAKSDWTAWAYGLDFGFVNPTALIQAVVCDGKLYLDEKLYQAGLTNSDLIERLSHVERADIYADSAEPDRIEEIVRSGWNIYPANKDVKMGLDVVKRQVVYITKESVATIKEFRGYSYKKDRDGHILEEPIKINDHACDATRYVALGLTERLGFSTARRVAVPVTRKSGLRWS